MKIHKSDPVALSGIAFKSWQEIMALVKERAIERAGLHNETKVFGRIQDDAQESWE